MNVLSVTSVLGATRLMFTAAERGRTWANKLLIGGVWLLVRLALGWCCAGGGAGGGARHRYSFALIEGARYSEFDEFPPLFMFLSLQGWSSRERRTIGRYRSDGGGA